VEPTTITELWYYILELRRDLTKVQIQLLEPQDAPRDVSREAAKLRQELARIHGRLSSLLQKIQHPSVRSSQ